MRELSRCASITLRLARSAREKLANTGHLSSILNDRVVFIEAVGSLFFRRHADGEGRPEHCSIQGSGRPAFVPRDRRSGSKGGSPS